MTVFLREADGRWGAAWRLLLPQLVFWPGWFVLNAITPAIPGVKSATGVMRYVVEVAFFATVLLWALFVFASASRWLEKATLADRGFDLSPRWGRQFGSGLLLGAFLVSAIFTVQLVFGWVTVKEGWRSVVLGVPLALGLSLVALKALLVASWEELVFRAGLIPGLTEIFGVMRAPRYLAVGLAIALPGTVFGLAHLANANATWLAALAIAVAGMFTGIIYVRTNSLALPIGAHTAWNFFQANIFGFPLSGQQAAKTSALVIEQHGPELWTGGSAGPEAGLLCLLVILAATALVVYLTPVHQR